MIWFAFGIAMGMLISLSGFLWLLSISRKRRNISSVPCCKKCNVADRRLKQIAAMSNIGEARVIVKKALKEITHD